MAEWAEPQLHGKDLIALATGNRFVVAVRKLCAQQYAVVDLTNGRFKIVSTIREAIEEYFGRIAWAVGALNFEEWENKFFDQKELNRRLADWHSHVRRSLCKNTESWVKEGFSQQSCHQGPFDNRRDLEPIDSKEPDPHAAFAKIGFAIDTNRRLGIFRNSEYPPIFR